MSTSHKKRSTKPLAHYLDGALGDALKKRGFANGDLIAHWPHIVPASFSECSSPEKLQWMRPSSNQYNDGFVGEGATLYVHVSNAKKLEFDYEKDVIRQAINQYFGFELVTHIRLSKTPFAPSNPHRNAPKKDLSKEALERIKSLTNHVEDEELQTALEQLGQNLAAKKSQNLK